jgi:hypothetical protein
MLTSHNKHSFMRSNARDKWNLVESSLLQHVNWVFCEKLLFSLLSPSFESGGKEQYVPGFLLEI